MKAGDPLIGRQLANFRIQRVIGRGGMAQVYYGWDVVLHRPVAIKIIDARFRNNPAYARRFVQEAQTVALWRHENIVSIYYAGQEDELYYFAMEYIDGVDLGVRMAQHTAAGRPMPWAEVLRIGRAIAGALDYAHEKGVIHRDVKPSNVLLANDGRVVLTDFGLALHTQLGSLGEVFGTAHYTAPEQARRSADALPQSDLYSFGVILYEMLAGRVPFDDPSPTSVALQHMTLPPPSPRAFNAALTAGVEAVLMKALSKFPGDRYPTGGELMDALESALQPKRPARTKPLPVPAPPARSQLSSAQPSTRASLVERVARRVEAEPTPPVVHPAEQSPRPAAPSPDSRGRSARFVTGGRFLIFAAIAAVSGVLLLNSQQGGASQAPTPTTAGVVEAVTLSAAPPTATAPPVTELPPATAAPTVLYPDGRRFVVYYDDNSLYVHNASGSAGAISPFAFERLDASGASLNRFEGWRWSRYYPRIEEEACARIEIRGSPAYLRPPECRSRYNSTVTAARGDDFVFWTSREGSSHFRVLWDEKEVARCEIGAGVCVVFLP